MHSLSRSIIHLTLALAVAVALFSICLAQGVASVDLTTIEQVPMRRPAATSPMTGGYQEAQQEYPCGPDSLSGGSSDSARTGDALRASLVSLDRTPYHVGDKSTFEVRIENTGSGPIAIPFSPHLANLQPQDPARKFSYSALKIVLWIAGGDHWSASTAGNIIDLYGDDDHPGSMLSLQPGQWARIIVEGKFALRPSHPNPQAADVIRSHPADHVYAKASIYHDETLVTPTQSATVEHEICIVHTPGESAPIELTGP